MRSSEAVRSRSGLRGQGGPSRPLQPPEPEPLTRALRLELVRAPIAQVHNSPRLAVLAAASSPFLPRSARRLVARACDEWGLSPLAESAVLAVDELVTNAVRYARTFVEVHVRHEGPWLVVAVHDGDPAFCPSWWDGTSMRPGSSDPELPEVGYGLELVRRLGERCGGFRYEEGKVMWTALAVPTQARGEGAEHVIDLTQQARRRRGEGAGDLGVHRVLAVNGSRGRTPDRRGWRLDLLVDWIPSAPDEVSLTLRPTPLHPSMPHGHWIAPLTSLRSALTGPAADGDVRLYPDPVGHMVLLELLEHGRPQVVHLAVRHLRDLVADIDESRRRHRAGHRRAVGH